MPFSKKTTPTLKLRTSLEITGLVVLGLMADQWLQPYGQWIVSFIVWAYFARFVYQSKPEERKRWWICLIIATVGEVLLSDLFHIYTYREGHIPLFVPPGHVLLYAMGLYVSRFVKGTVFWLTLSAAMAYALYCYQNSLDQISLVLFALWCLMLTQKKVRPLITTMFVLALLMEILGTSIGNWRWAETIYFTKLKLTQDNPPFAVGVLYCGLDYLVGLIENHLKPKVESLVES